MAKKKKKLIEIKGSKLQKTCVLIQLIVLVLTIVSEIYINVNNIESGFITEISNYSLYIIIGLLLLPIFFDGDNDK